MNVPCALEIGLVDSSETDQVVSLHCQSFPDSVLTAFGPEIVRDYYSSHLNGGQHLLTVGARVDGTLVGYCLLVRKTKMLGFLTSQMRHPRTLLLRLGTPGLAVRVLGSLGQSLVLRWMRLWKPTEASKSSCRLLAVGVSPQYEGIGVGRSLVERAELEAYVRGTARIGLSVKESNTRARRLYERCGWNSITRKGRFDGQMFKDLTLRQTTASVAPHCQDEVFTRKSGDRVIAEVMKEFERRNEPRFVERYSWHKSENQFGHVQLARRIIRQLHRQGRFPLSGSKLLDVGCGSGTWLLDFVQWGVGGRDLAGLDTDETRIAEARRRVPGADLKVGDARHLPWPDSHFDTVIQFTVFSSIPDPYVQAQIAAEMLRVLKPGGIIISYDLRWNNPANSRVHSVTKSDLRRIFPGAAMEFEACSLPAPIARAVVPISWSLALAVEAIPILRSHYCAFVTKT